MCRGKENVIEGTTTWVWVPHTLKRLMYTKYSYTCGIKLKYRKIVFKKKKKRVHNKEKRDLLKFLC